MLEQMRTIRTRAQLFSVRPWTHVVHIRLNRKRNLVRSSRTTRHGENTLGVTMLADPVVKEVHRPITKPPSHLLLIIFILFFYPPPVTHHHFLIR